MNFNIKQKFFLVTFLFTICFLQAQLITRENPNSTGGNSLAFIDGSSNPGYNVAGANYVGKGILFPSMDLTAALNGAPFDSGNVGAAAYNPNHYDGLVVYNTGTGTVTMGTSAEDVSPGFYYYSNPSRTAWDGGEWLPLGGGGSATAATVIDADSDTHIQVEEGTDDDFIRFDTAGEERAVINATGNVGIGTADPTEKLSVNDGDLLIQNHNSANRQVNLASNGSIDLNNVQEDLILSRFISPTNQNGGFGSALIDFRATNGPDEWTTAQIMGLTDAGSAGFAGGLAFATNAGGVTDPDGSGSRNRGSDPIIRMLVQADGDVGIGTTDPQAVLEVKSTNSGLLLPRVANTAAVTGAVNGMLIYDISSECVKGYENGAWSACLSSGGGATAGTITALDCSPFSGTAIQNESFFVSTSVSYTGGDEGSYFGAVINSTGVTGLTASYAGGTFATAGGSINMIIQGTPTTDGIASFTLNIGGQSCTVDIYVVGVVTCPTGEQWLDRNLGAQRVPTTKTDYLGYGDFYQYGRLADGHQVVDWTSSTTANLSPTTTTKVDYANVSNVGHGNFIASTSSPFSWVDRATLPVSPFYDNDFLWISADGDINNPCPAGFSIPTKAEIAAEHAYFSSQDLDGAFDSCLKIPAAGRRRVDGIGTWGMGSIAYLMTETTQVTVLNRDSFTSTELANYGVGSLSFYQSRDAASVRCIRD